MIAEELDLEAADWTEPDPPAPTMTPPQRSRLWWLWRAFGHLVFVPARRAWSRYNHCRYREQGGWTYRFPGSEKVRDWLWGRPGCPAWLRPVRKLLYWLLIADFHCTHCGFTRFDDEFELPDGRTVRMFEHVDGGGLDYWGEPQDAHGWQWCWRCGSVAWTAV